MPYARQLAGKQARLAGWFPDVEPAAMVPSPVEGGFRHKVAFVFAPGTGSSNLLMGHYQAGSARIVPVEECPVHSDRGNHLAFALRGHLALGRVPPGVLRHVLVRTTDDGREAVMMLVVTANHRSLRGPVRALLDSPARPDGFFVNIHDRPGPFMVGRETIRIDGRAHVREEMLGTSFLISPTAFFQTNVRAARELLRLVLDLVDGADRVLDLYSGSGLFAIPLARRGSRVVAVEENRQAVNDAEANLRLNRVADDSVRLLAARTEDAMARLSRERFEGVVLDPPRQGCPDAVLDAVVRLGARRVIYVSCNPQRLALERPRIERAGYRLSRLRGVDMFPHTDHIEAVATFERASTR